MSAPCRYLIYSSALLLLPIASVHGEEAKRASQFVDSVGVNTHLTSGSLYLDHFDLVVQRLRELGIHQVRAGLQSKLRPELSEKVKKLNEVGIKMLWVMSPDQSPSTLFSYVDKFPKGTLGFEAPNEFDAAKRNDWIPVMQQFMSTIYPVLKHDSRTADIPVIGPSLTQVKSYSALGSQGAFMDAANLHNYPAGRNPGTTGWGGPDKRGARYGSTVWNLDLGRDVWGGKPVWTTEFGYNNNPNAKEFVPEDVAAIYMPRALLEQYIQGIHHTFIFELVAAHPGNDGEFGILQPDGTPKPAFKAVANLLRLLRDDAAHFQTSGADLEIQGGVPDLHHILLQKNDSSYYLALWLERPCYNPDTRKRIPVEKQKLSIKLGIPMKDVRSFRFDEAGDTHESDERINDGRVAVDVSDKLLVLRYSRQ